MMSQTINHIDIPKMITGTFKHKNPKVLKEIVNHCLLNGFLGFDTAPSYKTERLLGQILRKSLSDLKIDREQIFISTKIDAWQMQQSNGDIAKYVEDVLKKMGIDYLDQLLIHWPIPKYFEKTWMSFINLYRSDKVKIIGVSNVRERHILKLMEFEVAPMVVQNERHPLRSDREMLNFCKQKNIVYQAYSPVGQMMDKIKNSELLMEIAQKYSKSIGQVILRWHIDSGSIPVFKTSKISRINEYKEVLEFTLDKEDIVLINDMNIDHKIFLESSGCPGF